MDTSVAETALASPSPSFRSQERFHLRTSNGLHYSLESNRELSPLSAMETRMNLSPFRLVPPEIMKHIFYFCTEPLRWTPGKPSSQTSLGFCGVCQFWRHVAFQTPVIWSEIVVVNEVSRSNAVEKRCPGTTNLARWLSLSDNFPLDITYITNGRSSVDEPVLSVLFPHLWHVQKLYFEPRYLPMTVAKRFWTALRTPQLRELTLVDHIGWMNGWLERWTNAGMPRSENAVDQCFPVVLPNLETLELHENFVPFICANLQSIKLVEIHFSAGKLAYLADVAPKLASFVIAWCGFVHTDSDWTLDNTVFKHLKYIGKEGTDEDGYQGISVLLNASPALTTLSLELGTLDIMPTLRNLPSLLELRLTLPALYGGPFDISEERCLSFLSVMPALSSLSLCSSGTIKRGQNDQPVGNLMSNATTLINALLFKPIRMCPSLRCLSITSCIIEECSFFQLCSQRTLNLSSHDSHGFKVSIRNCPPLVDMDREFGFTESCNL